MALLVARRRLVGHRPRARFRRCPRRTTAFRRLLPPACNRPRQGGEAIVLPSDRRDRSRVLDPRAGKLTIPISTAVEALQSNEVYLPRNRLRLDPALSARQINAISRHRVSLMRTFIAIVLIGLAALLAIPPQVQTVEHTFQTTRVSFWYPSIVEINGELAFTDQLLVAAEESIDWARDSLRSGHFLCGNSSCRSEVNPVAKAWRNTSRSIDATNKDIARFGAAIAAAKTKQQSMLEYIEKSSCEQLSRGPEKPTFACSESEAEEVATTTCVIRELGAKACEKGGKELLEGDAPKFLKDAAAREGCGALVHEITGDKYNILEKTIRKYTVELGITIISEIFGYFSKNLKEGFDWSVAAMKAKACIPHGVNLCRQKFVDWQEASSAHFAKFDQGIRWCNEARTILAGAESEINSNERHLETANTHLSRLSQEKDRLQQTSDVKTIPHLLQIL